MANEAEGKAMQRKTHPDAGGSAAELQEVQEAISESGGSATRLT